MLFKDLQTEHAVQAFERFDVSKTGSITPLAFRDIMETIRPHLLTEFVQENLITVSEKLISEKEDVYGHSLYLTYIFIYYLEIQYGIAI